MYIYPLILGLEVTQRSRRVVAVYIPAVTLFSQHPTSQSKTFYSRNSQKHLLTAFKNSNVARPAFVVIATSCWIRCVLNVPSMDGESIEIRLIM